MRLRRLGVSLIICLLLIGLTVWAAGRPRQPTSSPLSLDTNVDEREITVRSPQGWTMFHDFRVVEPQLVYRGTGFPDEAAFADDSAFNFLRSRNIRRVIALQEDAERFYAEEGYFNYWGDRTGYRIAATWLPVEDARAFARDDRGGLHAAAEFLFLMKDPPQDGAVLVHDDRAGRDATGVVVAGYELARNRRWVEPDTLWGQVVRRYLMTNALAGSDLGVDAAELERIRSDLETLAEL